MPRPEDFRGKPSWTKEDLVAYLALRARESPSIEYKDARWVAEENATELRSGFGNDLREYCAAMSTDGGGLLFLGIGEVAGQRGLPGQPAGIPTTVWGRSPAAQRILDILSNGILPPMYPPARVHAVEVEAGREVIVVDLPRPASGRYAVTHGGGFTPIRVGETVGRASPAVEALMGGARSEVAAIELHPYDRQEIRSMPERAWQWHLDRPRLSALYPFVLRNHGTLPARDLRIGIIGARNDGNSVDFFTLIPDYPLTEEAKEEVPRHLRQKVNVRRPMVKEFKLGRPLDAHDEFEFSVGMTLQSLHFLRRCRIIVYVVGTNIEPIIRAFHIYGISGGDFPYGIEPVEEPWNWGGEDRF